MAVGKGVKVGPGVGVLGGRAVEVGSGVEVGGLGLGEGMTVGAAVEHALKENRVKTINSSRLLFIMYPFYPKPESLRFL